MISRRKAERQWRRWDRYIFRWIRLGLDERSAGGCSGVERAYNRVVDAHYGRRPRPNRGYTDKCTRGACEHAPCGRRVRQEWIWNSRALEDFDESDLFVEL